MRARVAFSIAVTFLASSARADDVVDLPPAEVEVTPKTEAALSTGVATVLAPAKSVGTTRSLADLLATTPGVHVRRTGLPGSFSTVSIRGLGSDNVAVVLDDIPLTSATLGAVDLGAFPAASLERIEVYRGTGPVRFDTPLGGVVRLVTRPPADRLAASAHLGYGSFATRSAHAELTGPLGGYRLSFFAGYEGTRGDFRYFENDQLYSSGDPSYLRRSNNGADLLFVRGAVEHDGPAGSTLKLALSGFGREQGVAGYGDVRTESSHAAEREVVGRLSLTNAELGATTLSGGLDVLGATRSFRDPENQTKLDVFHADTTLGRAAADLRVVWGWSLTQQTELAPRVSWEHFEQTGRTLGPEGKHTTNERLQLGGGLEHRADLGPVRLVPSVRADVMADRGDRAAGTLTMVSPRLGLLWALDPCEVRANGGRFHRIPTTLERFGDGVNVWPNLALVPERGLSADAAISCEVAAPLGLRVRPEVAGFVTRATGLVVYMPSDQHGVMAGNLGTQDIRGVETSLSARVWLVSLDAAYTFTRGVDVSGVHGWTGKSTPGVPRHRLDLGVELGNERYGVRWELAYNSLFYLNQDNHGRPVPQRFIHDVYAHADLGAGLTAKLSVTNLTDLMAVNVHVPGASRVGVRNVDFLGYPLPGRAVFVAMLWRLQ